MLFVPCTLVKFVAMEILESQCESLVSKFSKYRVL